MENKVRLRAVTITREALKEKYELELSDLEWRIIKEKIESEWQDESVELLAMAAKAVRNAVLSSGFKADISSSGQLIYTKVDK